MPKRLKEAIEKGLRFAFFIAFEMLLAVLDKFLEACGCSWHREKFNVGQENTNLGGFNQKSSIVTDRLA